jgi:[acyl-carrier-protein] S-malonyltransferase
MRAFLFAGQGSQKVGMGVDLTASSEVCRATFKAADEALGFPLSRLMVVGPEEALRRTEIAQPALLTLAVAQARYLMAHGTMPGYLSGHSLGQYTALVIAGSLDFQDCVRLVHERGRLMQEIVPEGQGAMIAVIALDRELVYEACHAAKDVGIVDVACHNAPGQTVVSGTVAAIEAVAARCEEEGGGIVPLSVSAPFHCRLLEPMVPIFSNLLNDIPIKAPGLPVFDNVTAQPLSDAESVRQSLITQIMSPVLFEESLQHMVLMGVNHFIECGPGKNLISFAKRVAPGAICETFEQQMTPMFAFDSYLSGSHPGR